MRGSLRSVAAFLLALGLSPAGCASQGEDEELPIVEAKATSADGTGIWYRAVGGQRAGAETVLLMHGGPGLGSDYLALLEELATPERRVVRLNQRGVPASERPANDDYALARILEDIDAVLAELGVDRVTFVGHSWGGFVGMHYVVRSPARVRSIVLVDSMAPSAAAGAAGFAARQQRIVTLQGEGIIASNLPNSVSDLCGWVAAILPAYFADPAFPPPPELTANPCDQQAARGTWDQNGMGAYDLTADLAALQLPVLVVTGELDFFAGMAAATAAAFTPDAPIATVAAAGHFPWLEQPDATLAALRDFLDDR
jgi:pimeloyl-ACP methyl ester carboxylesterase